MKEYKGLYSETIDELVREINKNAQEGWECQGGISSNVLNFKDNIYFRFFVLMSRSVKGKK